AVFALFGVAYTTGFPFGPQAGEPEELGPVVIISKLVELALLLALIPLVHRVPLRWLGGRERAEGQPCWRGAGRFLSRGARPGIILGDLLLVSKCYDHAPRDLAVLLAGVALARPGAAVEEGGLPHDE